MSAFKSITVKSFAKLNLILKVLGKRQDGFHELETIFERISLFDLITLTQTLKDIKITCQHPHVPLGGKNLVYKVALKLKHDFNISGGVSINIDKQIPVAAGLAGGSSNAAAVLVGLNRLWKLGLSKAQLVQYAASIGSDVAFFLYDCSYALGKGRGEQIKPLDIKTKLWHVLVTPRLKVYTPQVFAKLGLKHERLNLKLTRKKDDVSILLPFLRKNNIYSVCSTLSNDLEPAILALKPHLGLLKNKLIDAGALGVCFSGSGPSVFAIAKSQQHAMQIKQAFDKRFAQVFVVSTI